MGPAGRFAELVQRAEESIALDEAALLVAAAADSRVDVNLWLAVLDDLASRCDDRSLTGVVQHLAREGFRGDRSEYYDPRNSYLNHVLERRRGIPITLSIATIEVGRRLGVPIVGIGMPGHFVVRDGHDGDAFADPFNGVLLDRAGCARLLSVVQPDVAFDDSFLAPVGPRAIVTRLLANLKGIHTARRDRAALISVLQLRLAIPGVPLQERRELASALAADGRFLEAASALDELAALARDRGFGPLVEEAEQGAIRLRARLN
ncbi:MAG TPA: transglutaminase-like domain-containing protein [Acidimicrobiales bacterium]|nr:transglutaminase-like domain-containing protein [Acidimicrobiales bacterium]